MSALRVPLFTILCAVTLCSCAVRPTKYEPIGEGDFGYSEMQLGDSTFRVVFAGNEKSNLERVDRYAIYRSAELTLLHGGDYFTVFSDKVDINTTSMSGSTANSAAGVTHDAQPIGSVFPTTTTASASTSMSSYSVTQTLHSSIKNIRIFSGKPPTNDPTVYDARAILRNMGDQTRSDEKKADSEASSTNAGYTVLYVVEGVAMLVLVVMLINGFNR
jgi:hypothetical protein